MIDINERMYMALYRAGEQFASERMHEGLPITGELAAAGKMTKFNALNAFRAGANDYLVERALESLGGQSK